MWLGHDIDIMILSFEGLLFLLLFIRFSALLGFYQMHDVLFVTLRIQVYRRVKENVLPESWYISNNN